MHIKLHWQLIVLLIIVAKSQVAIANDPAQQAISNDVTVLHGDIATDSALLRDGLRSDAAPVLWDDGVIPYVLGSSLPLESVKNIRSAIRVWNASIDVTLVEIDAEASDAPADYVVFVPADICASWVGKRGGMQRVWVSFECGTGSVIHEIGHVIGLEHEHTRPDRDQFVAIHWDNIDQSQYQNFEVKDDALPVHGSYDYASIMHYGEYFFSKNGAATMEPLKSTNSPIGQRLVPSDGDIAKVSSMYSATNLISLGAANNESFQSPTANVTAAGHADNLFLDESGRTGSGAFNALLSLGLLMLVWSRRASMVNPL